MDLEQVKQFLNENKDDKEVSAYLGELRQPTAQDVEGYLDTADGQKVLQPRLDSYFTKGLNTWKENNLNKLVDAEVKKLNPEMTEEQRQINELKQQLEDQRKEAAREKNMNKAISHATDKQLPANSDLLSFFVGDDEESTLNNLGVFEETFNSAIQKAIESKFKESGREIESGSKPANNIQDLSEIAKSVNIRNQ